MATARRVEAMSKETSALVAASYVLPDLVVAVQEAVYNAIDANARHVSVVADVARASFTVADDGDGIHPDEMFEHLFESRASSKGDPSSRKYGRRGQYLVALGTLAKQVVLESRVEGHWTSFRKVVQNAQIVFNARSKIIKTTKGTEVRVQSLFWLLPVRQRELEAHSSAQTRVVKRLSSFCSSISMIWPTLSIELSFPDTKVPRSVIPGVSTCEERLRDVFGDILGADLEYLCLDTKKSPFIIRGYAAVIRDAGGGDSYLESPGWRQARAYYQFVFLDNFWIEDFQNECCKTINTSAIELELGIPIFVLKISTKSNEYEVYSDGQTQIVNLKRPELVLQALRRFVQTLQSRVEEADTLAGSNPSYTEVEAAAFEHLEAQETGDHAFAVSSVSSYIVTPQDSTVPAESEETCTSVGSSPDVWAEMLQLEREMVEMRQDSTDGLYQRDARTELTWFNDAIHVPARYHHEVVDCCYDDSGALLMIQRGEIPSTVLADGSDRLNQWMTDAYSGYEGCAHCGSCARLQHPPCPRSQLFEEPMNYALSEYDTLQSLEYGFDSYVECYDVAGSQHTINRGNACHDFVADARTPCYHAVAFEDTGREEDTTHQRTQAQSTGRFHQQRELSQLFFGKSERSLPTRGRELTHRPGLGSEKWKSKEDADVWVSSRRVGGLQPDYAQVTWRKGDQRSDHQIQTVAVNCDEGGEDEELGSVHLSEYFSLEKLVKTHSRSLRRTISRFASKRTALAGLVGSCGLEDGQKGIYVRKLPRDLHSSNTEAVTLDKGLLHRLQVIKQVDRKFILVKATLNKLKDEDEENDSRTLLLCIDQHAADERVRLEQLELQVFGVRGDERHVDVVTHTPPLVLSLNKCEREAVSFFAEEIKSWRFHVELVGDGTLSLTHTPRIDTRVAGADDFREYLQVLTRNDSASTHRVLRPPVITRFLHSRACRSAIMFGDYLSLSQCEDIIDQLRHCNLPFQCAHGRPSVVPLAELH